MSDTSSPAVRRKRMPKPLDSARLEELALAYVARFSTTAARLDRYLRRKLRERGWGGEGEPSIATLVERSTRYVMLTKIEDKNSDTVIDALIKVARKLPQELNKSITWDRGSEMANHKRFTLATDIQVYFCDPQNPWQRGTNENTNGLLRQYFPKGLDLSTFTQAQLNKVARQLNERPRKTLNYETPIERYRQTVASIG